MQRDGIEFQVTVPHLAESLVSATVVSWLKQPGDDVREYEPLCELATDKVNVEMPSPVEGTMLRLLAADGDTVDVGAPICVIRQAGPAVPSTALETPPADDGQRARYSPAVARLAMEHGIDLRQVKGTSLGGRINRRDVLAYAAKMRESGVPAATVPKESPVSAAAAPNDPISGERKDPAWEGGSKLIAERRQEERSEDLHLEPTPMRKTISQRTRHSVSEIPHAWMTIETDVTRLVELRNQLKDDFERREGARLTVTPFVIKAIVNAIKEYPMLNATWSQEHIVLKKSIHVAVAVGTEQSVVTPVLRDADRKTVAGLAIELDGLARRARIGKLTLDDLQGGTVTFNNTGSFGSVLSYPIIQYPQAAMITFEAIVRKPVVIQQDMIAIRSMANMCLSLDHRILDGMVCGRFLQRVKHYVEQYGPDTQIY